jgi:hypothetical protein
MEVMYPRCCGLDVHKSSITACILLAQSGKPLEDANIKLASVASNTLGKSGRAIWGP